MNLSRVWLLSPRQIYCILSFACYICETSIIFPWCKWSHFCCFPCNTMPRSFLLRKFQEEKQFVRMTGKWLLICVHHRLLWDTQILIPTEFQEVNIKKKIKQKKPPTSTNLIIKILIQHRLIEKSDLLLSLLERREISEYNDSLSTIWGLHLKREH